MHLTMRLADVERRDALRGEGAIGGLLKTLVHRVDMRILAGPLVAEELGDPGHQGWSGVVILYESHAAIHTYPELGQAFLDVFSCREFDLETVKDTLAGFFGEFTVVESKLVDRGIHWSADVEREMASWRLVRS